MAASVHSVDAGSLDELPAAVAAKIASIPKMMFNARPLPQSYQTIRRNIEDSAVESAWSGLDLFCRVCMPVSRDLALFCGSRSTTPEQEKHFIAWKFTLADLADAAEKGCYFCGFIAVRFFNDRGYTFIYSNTEEKGALGCCMMADPGGKAVTEAVERLRTMTEKYPGAWFELIAQPTDYDLPNHGFGRIRFQAASSNVPDPKGILEVLGFRREIVLEVYGMPGNFHHLHASKVIEFCGLMVWQVRQHRNASSIFPRRWSLLQKLVSTRHACGSILV